MIYKRSIGGNNMAGGDPDTRRYVGPVHRQLVSEHNNRWGGTCWGGRGQMQADICPGHTHAY